MDEKIKITKKMLKAGVAAVLSWDNEIYEGRAEIIATSVYEAMVRARQGKGIRYKERSRIDQADKDHL